MGNVGCSRILIVWVACILGAVLSAFWLNPKLKVFLEGEYWEAMGRFDESLRLTHAEYVDENQSGFNDLVERAIEGMVSGLDRHSSYYPPVEYKAFQDDTYNRYVGIGVMIRKVEKGVLLTKVFPRGPADVAGIKPGAFILEVGGEPMEGLELDEVSSRIKGEKGTFVDLLLMSADGEERKARVKRDEIEVSSVEQAVVDENGTAYLHLIKFTERTEDEVREAVSGFNRNHGFERMVLDLRDNAGGLLTAAIEVADLFLEKDLLIVSVREREGLGKRDFLSASSRTVDVPLVVLLNEGSASASEIVAGALSVHGRAELVGEKSFGKGSVQTIFPLEDGSGLRLTTAMYFLPDGRTIHEQGIEPDFLVACSEGNETKLRVQRYGRRDLTDRQFEELFGFAPIPDLQRLQAIKLLLQGRVEDVGEGQALDENSTSP